jgi:hypothetical protein
LTCWAAAGAPSSVLTAMKQAEVRIADLSGDRLGMESVGRIVIDDDAAGYGWFVDPTPAQDAEFARQGTDQQRHAVDPRALDRIDLLTVVEHEMGHVAGLDDLDPSAGSLMSGRLGTGIRRDVGQTEIDAIFAEGKWA